MSPISAVMMISSLIAGLQAARTRIASQRPRKRIAATSGLLQEPLEVEVVLIRHGKSFWNKHEIKGGLSAFVNKISNGNLLEAKVESFKDAPLIGLGVEQAMNLQGYLYKIYRSFDPAKIQLAASGLSRAYDTLVVATAALWSRWNREEYKIHLVPSLMEFGNVDTERRGDLADNDVVEKADSIFGPKDANLYSNLEEHLTHAWKMAMLNPETGVQYPDWASFYADQSTGAQGDNVQVQLDYPRHHSSKCNEAQIYELEKYLKDMALLGKEVIVAGTHSNLIKCAANHFPIVWPHDNHKVDLHTVELKGRTSIKATNITEEKVDITDEKVPNGGVLTLTMKLTPVVNGDPCEGRLLPMEKGKVCLEFHSPFLVGVDAPTSRESLSEESDYTAFKEDFGNLWSDAVFADPF